MLVVKKLKIQEMKPLLIDSKNLLGYEAVLRSGGKNTLYNKPYTNFGAKEDKNMQCSLYICQRISCANRQFDIKDLFKKA